MIFEIGLWCLVGGVLIAVLSRVYLRVSRYSRKRKGIRAAQVAGLGEDELKWVSTAARQDGRLDLKRILSSLAAFDERIGGFLGRYCIRHRRIDVVLAIFRRVRDKLVAQRPAYEGSIPGMGRIPLLAEVSVRNCTREEEDPLSCCVVENRAGKIRLAGGDAVNHKGWQIGDLLAIAFHDAKRGDTEVLVKFCALERKESGLFLAAFDYPCERRNPASRKKRQGIPIEWMPEGGDRRWVLLEKINFAWAHLVDTEPAEAGASVQIAPMGQGQDGGTAGTVIYCWSSGKVRRYEVGVYFEEVPQRERVAALKATLTV